MATFTLGYLYFDWFNFMVEQLKINLLVKNVFIVIA